MKKLFAVALGILAAIGGFVDIGDLVTNAVVGSRFGLGLAWVVLVGVVGICVYAQMSGRAPLPAGLTRQGLPRLPMQRVLAAPAAVLRELDAVRRVPFGLLCLVVTPPALRAGKRDCDSDSGCHVSPYLRRTIAAAGLEPATRGL